MTRVDLPPPDTPVTQVKVQQYGNGFSVFVQLRIAALFTCVAGASGGKSTLVIETLYKAAARRLIGRRHRRAA
jgi:excinuclease ABC subunit A